ncbi:Peroxisomal hydratase-dehydrogenase-epimerase [Elsinoe australis]|uniref:Peroxisomal hydratase-dehydrogenase-epimerase n=1 Tax=Elsinoe australis TaxID=40998 RepID=A0A2P7ZQD1_9PEZI|nr:Peroxisomal hydratase-dehydrogenase-epimerase [Elsinoe australis]
MSSAYEQDAHSDRHRPVDIDSLHDEAATEDDQTEDITLIKDSLHRIKTLDDVRSELSHMDLGPATFETHWPDDVAERHVQAFDGMVRFILAELILCIKSMGLDPYHWLAEKGCTRTFAYFLLLVDQAWLATKLLAAVPRHVKIIIGNPRFKLEELKLIPILPIQLLRLYGVYADLIETLLLELLIYIGSGTGIYGTFGRLKT